jgi:hypothetical protein
MNWQTPVGVDLSSPNFGPVWSISTIAILRDLISSRILKDKLRVLDLITTMTAVSSSTISQVLLHPKVSTVCSQLAARGYDAANELAKVFVKTFQEDGDRQFPIDFDDAWIWLRFSRKDTALRSLKTQFSLNSEYSFEAGHVRLQAEGSMTPDKYFLSTNAFERFALGARTEVGNLVRDFFIAIRDAYVDLTTNPQPPAPRALPPASMTKEQAMILTFHKQNCIYLGEIQAPAPGVPRLLKFGQTSDIRTRYDTHKGFFKAPYFFELLHVTNVSDCRKAEEIFKNFPEISTNMCVVTISGSRKREVFAAPTSLTPRRLQSCLTRAARLSDPEFSLDEGGLLLAREVTAQAREVTAQSRIALELQELKFRMMTFEGPHCVTPQAASPVDAVPARERAPMSDDKDEEYAEELTAELPNMLAEDEEAEEVLPVHQVPIVQAEEAIPVAAVPNVQAEEFPLSDLVNVGHPMPDVAAVLEAFVRTSCNLGPRLQVFSRTFSAKLHEGLAAEDVDFFKPRVVGRFLSKFFLQLEFTEDGRRGRGFRGLTLKPVPAIGAQV